jgi:hypothetical protein
MLEVKVYPDLYSPHTTQVYSGLYDLAEDGKILLEATSRFDGNIKRAARNSVLCLQVSDTESGRTRTVCFDLFDGCEISSVERLRLCDVYLKRSYYDKYIDALDHVDRKKIMPYGLNYECRSRNEREIFRRLFIFHSANGSFSKDPLHSLKDFSSGVLRYLLLKTDLDILGLKPMSIGDFVVQPDEPAELKILLQTRLWTSRECPRISDSRLKEINDMRVNTVRSLKRKFGGQFLGGLLPTDAARRDYPDLCVPMGSTKRRAYMDAVKKCLVCVTTTGLHDSIGFRLPEYLAASRCIVTEPLKYQLPVSLIEGTNYLSFRTPDECVRACERLLASPQLANQMRYENHKYYLNEVEPAALVHKCLTTAMSLQ